jgi:hypothetical protein
MKILIIEDEPFARTELIRLLNATGREFTVLEQIDTVDDSIKWLKTHYPARSYLPGYPTRRRIELRYFQAGIGIITGDFYDGLR